MWHRCFRALAIVALTAVFSSEVVADHHEAGEVEMAVRQFYAQLSAGEYQEALGHVKLGANGYVAEGLLATMVSEEVREMVVTDMKEAQENGAEMTLRPEYINVAVHGNIAIATYLVDAMTKDSGDDEEKQQVNRGSLVWQNTDDGWKIVHWHVSKLTTDEDD
jgi:hypothetical protein